MSDNKKDSSKKEGKSFVSKRSDPGYKFVEEYYQRPYWFIDKGLIITALTDAAKKGVGNPDPSKNNLDFISELLHTNLSIRLTRKELKELISLAKDSVIEEIRTKNLAVLVNKRNKYSLDKPPS